MAKFACMNQFELDDGCGCHLVSCARPIQDACLVHTAIVLKF